MTNFAHLRCPKCGDQDHIDIAATIWVRATADGTDASYPDDSSHDWDDASVAVCRNVCGFVGKVTDFRGPMIRLDYTTLAGFKHTTAELSLFLQENTEGNPDFPAAEIEAAIAKGETYRLAIHAGLFVDISKA